MYEIKMEKILITGINGDIGTVLKKELVKENQNFLEYLEISLKSKISKRCRKSTISLYP